MARGSVYKRHGGWAYKIDTGFNPETGKRRQATKQGFRTKKEAENALAEAQKTVIDGTVVANSSMTLTAYLDEWLAGQRSRLRPTSHHSYMLASKRLHKHLGRYRLQSLTPLQIEKFYADLLDHGRKDGTGLAPKSVKNTHVVLRKALADAERLGLVPRNAAAAARAPSMSRPEMTTWSSDQLKSFLADREHRPARPRLHAARRARACGAAKRSDSDGETSTSTHRRSPSSRPSTP